MRPVILFAILLLAAITFIAAGCLETESESDGEAATFSQKQPVDPASPDDPDVISQEPEEGDAEESAVDEAAEEESDESESTEDVTVEEESEGKTEGEEGVIDEKEKKAESNIVVFETTKGDIVVELHEEWAPIGVAHFKELINAGFYDGAPWFRVLDGFVAQCGVAADPALNEKWGEATIKDEPVIKGNVRGTIVYGKSSLPDSRSTHIFINFVDNSAKLDQQGFSAFGEVIEGMDVADSLFSCEFRDQPGLAAEGGLEKFKATFPDADYIKRAYFK
ncbi:peptidylprolyl isomerase [bacterium]|nr:peptidylprolyl isomerase [bacterium]